jgi:hypothetical protein
MTCGLNDSMRKENGVGRNKVYRDHGWKALNNRGASGGLRTM